MLIKNNYSDRLGLIKSTCKHYATVGLAQPSQAVSVRTGSHEHGIVTWSKQSAVSDNSVISHELNQQFENYLNYYYIYNITHLLSNIIYLWKSYVEVKPAVKQTTDQINKPMYVTWPQPETHGVTWSDHPCRQCCHFTNITFSLKCNSINYSIGLIRSHLCNLALLMRPYLSMDGSKIIAFGFGQILWSHAPPSKTVPRTQQYANEVRIMPPHTPLTDSGLDCTSA